MYNMMKNKKWTSTLATLGAQYVCFNWLLLIVRVRLNNIIFPISCKQ